VPSRRIVDGLLDAVLDAFGPVLPDGVFLVKEGRGYHSAESRDGALIGGNVTASAPPFPVSDDKALGLGLHAYAETLRHFVSEVTDAPWPEPGAKTQVSVKDGIRIWFGPKSIEQAVLTLPVITWSGPVFDVDASPEAASHQWPRYAGALTDEQRAEETRLREEVRQESRARQQAANAAFTAARARAPGRTPDQMRAVVREEFAARGQSLPGGVEDAMAGLLAIPHNPHPGANAAKLVSKSAILAVRWLRAHRDEPGATGRQ
jgi:hypothetical protein